MEWQDLKKLLQIVRWRISLLVLLVTGSAMGVCYTVHCNRQSFNELQKTYRLHNDIEVQWSQLLIQYNTLTSYARIEKLAEQKLNMLVPEQKNIVLVRP